MSKELKQQIEALETENQLLKRQLEQKSKVASRALASYQQRSLHMEIIRQKNQDLDQLAGDLDVRAQELTTTNKALEKEIYERGQAELAAKENQHLYQSTVDVLPQNIIRKDKELRFVFGNKAFLELLGMPLEELVGKTDYDLYPKDLADQYTNDDRRVLESDQTFETIESHKSPTSDELLYVRVIKTPIRDQQGEIDGLQIVFWDVTERVKTEQALAKRATELETVAQVGVAASTILDVNELLQQVTDLTKESFGLYHTHIYLLDESGDTLTLAAGAGDVGRKMVLQGWSISLMQEQSLVAQVARNRQGVVVNNVREAPDWLPNPLLPNTYAELAVPMVVGDHLLGVVDIQADDVDYFTEDDVRIQTTFAAQIAVALQNARLFQQTQQSGNLLRKRVQELDVLTFVGREIAEAPPVAELLQSVSQQIPSAMQYPDICKVAITYNDQTFGDSEAIDLPNQIVNALRVENEVVGRIYIAYQEKQEFLNEESALLGGIANRVGSYMENRNLVEQTQQRATELEETTSFLDTIFDNLSVMIFVKEAKELRHVRWNKAGLELIGHTAEEMIGKNDYDFFPKEEADFFMAKDRETLEKGELVEIPEEPLRTASGETRWLYTRKTPVYSADGQPRYLLGISVDITERKEAEVERDRLLAEMQQSQELLRTVIDATPDWIFIKDRDHRFSLANKGFADSQNMTVDELIGKNDLDLGVPEDIVKGNPEKGIKGFWPDDDEVLESGQTKVVAMEPTVIDGKQAYLSTIKVPLSDASGNRWGVLAFVRDVTQREQLLVEVQRLAAIVENHPDFIAIGSLDGYPYYINPAGLKMIGLPPDHDVTTMQSTDFYPPADVERLGEGIQIAMEQGFWLAETNLLRADGSATPVERTISVIRDASGKPSSFSITMRDITDRKQADVERERLLAEVEATYRQYVRGEWEQYLTDEHSGRWHIEYEQPGMLASPANGNDTAKIETPIALRGQQIGKFNLEDIDPNRKWTSEELALVETVSGQLAQTIENLRLFGDTQQRATREQLTRQIADKMRAAPDVDTIVHTGLGELAKVLGVSRTYLKLNTEFEQDE